jgi:hypothetical protein
MTLVLAAPELVGRKGSTKDLISRVLSEEWSRSIKEIHNRLSRQFNYNASYQATHKTLAELEGNILAKEGKRYLLDIFKIKETKRVLELLENKVQSARVLKQDESKVYFFNSFKEWSKNTTDSLRKNTNLESDEKCYIYGDFTISLLTMAEEGYKWLASLNSKAEK